LQFPKVLLKYRLRDFKKKFLQTKIDDYSSYKFLNHPSGFQIIRV